VSEPTADSEAAQVGLTEAEAAALREQYLAHPDPKYRVEMRSVTLAADGALIRRERFDYVPQSILAGYVEHARTLWQSVVMSEEPDFGPAGIDGDTVIPDHLAVQS
jgi:hypothetical protein